MGELPFFGITTGTIGGRPVTVSRTGYTGDLGYEIWVDTPDAITVWDTVWDAAEGYGVLPYGMGALYMLRIEAGLLLLGADFGSSRFAFNDAHRSTPLELGWAWMFKGLEDDDRPFIGRRALERERAEKTSRWRMVGLVVDWQDYDRAYSEAGLIPPEGPPARPRGLDGVRRRSDTRRLRDQHHVLAGAAAAHRAGARATRPGQARQLASSWSSRWTTITSRWRRTSRGCPSTTRSARPPDGPMSTDRYDAIVVGGGHNGLVNGAYLAKAGLKTLILERRHLVGGAAITEELRPGYWFTTFSYALSLLRPQIIQELELPKHGFMPLLMSTRFAPGEDGEYLRFNRDHDETLREIARISPHDADAYEQYSHDLDRVCQAIKPLLDTVPPDLFSDDPEELLALAAVGSRLRSLDKRTLHNAVRLLTGSAADFLDDYFESGPAEGVPRLVVDHRLEGRTAVAGLGAGAALPLPGRARRRVRFVGLPQGRQRRLHPGPGPRGGVVRRRDPDRGAGRARAHPRRRGDRRGARRRHRDRAPTWWSARSTRGAPSWSWSTRASCPTTWSRTSAA